MRRSVVLLFALLGSVASAFAQNGNDELRAVVIVARHGVRTPIESETRSGVFNAQPWPQWPSEPGLLTPHGVDALKRMGEFYKLRYGSLAGCKDVAVESTNTPRTIASAKAVMSVVVPGCEVQVKADLTADPATIDKAKQADAINGRMGDQPEWFTHAFARPLAEMHDVLTKCAGCKEVPDFRTMMIDITPNTMMGSPGLRGPLHKPDVLPRDARKENAVTLGADFAENFLLQYVEGMPMQKVGWGRVSRAKLDDLMEMNTRYHDFMLRTPYYAQQAAGPLAEKISGWLIAQAQGTNIPFRIGRPDVPTSGGESFLYLSAHDANLTWLGGLLRMDWVVSDETLNATPPGSALVFELRCKTGDRRSDQTDTCTVRVMFVAQTLDQIRELTSLTGAEKPSMAPVYVPGCSGPGPEYACTVKEFARVVSEAVR